MADERRTTDRWALVGAGQCGRRVAATICEQAVDRGVCDRTVLVDTSLPPRCRTLDRLASALAIERSVASREHLVTFETDPGLGRTIFDDPASATAEVASLADSIGEAIPDANAVVHVLGLGGDVGNSVVPRVIDRLSRSANGGASADSGASGGSAQFALGVWPFEHEASKRHFDAVCGLSRLLRREDGTPNADTTLLVSNSRLSEIAGSVGRSLPADLAGEEPTAGPERPTDELARINDAVAEAIRLLVRTDREQHAPDVAASIAGPPQRRVGHGTVGIALAKPIGIGLPWAIRRAAENAFVPLDCSTVETAHVVVRAPDRRVEAGDVTERGVREAFDAWSSANDHPGPTGGSTLSTVPGDGSTMDVLVFLGGFDLSPLLSTSWDAYETVKADLVDSGSDELIERVRRLEANLRAYRNALDRE